MPELLRDGLALAYDEAGAGEPPLVFVHGVACHRGFWPSQVEHFSRHHRVVAVDLRGHGESDARRQRYTTRGFADDVGWMCEQLGAVEPVMIGHSLGGLVALELAGAHPKRIRAAALIDSVLLPGSDRQGVVRRLVAGLRGHDPERVLRDHFAAFFGPYDDPARTAWIMEQAIRTAPHVTSSVWEESLRDWDDAEALRRCQIPLAYLDAGTPNSNLLRARELQPRLIIGRTLGSGHFSPIQVPDQINAMLERFLEINFGCLGRDKADGVSADEP